jgi:hypothetical protein
VRRLSAAFLFLALATFAPAQWIEKNSGDESSFDGRVVHRHVDLADKLIAVGLNYADHIAEMKRTPLGTPLIWFKAPTSLLPHEGTIEIAFPEHKTDFEVELAIVIGARTKNVSGARARSRFRLHDRRRHQRPRFAKLRETIRAPNPSTPIRRSARSFTPTSTSAICRSRCGKTAK